MIIMKMDAGMSEDRVLPDSKEVELGREKALPL